MLPAWVTPGGRHFRHRDVRVHTREHLCLQSHVCVCAQCVSCEMASADAMFRKPSRYDINCLIFFYVTVDVNCVCILTVFEFL